MQSSLREKGSAVSRVMQIIEAVSKAERPLSPADLAIFLHIPKPSIHRLLNQLEEDGFVQTTLRGLIIPGIRMHGVAWGVLHSERPVVSPYPRALKWFITIAFNLTGHCS